MSIQRVGDLDIEQDIDYQRKEWRFQRMGWAVMLLLVVGALAGLLGRGPLSKTSLADQGSLERLEYHRFVHYRDPEQLKLQLSAEATQGEQFRIWLSHAYFSGIEIQSVTPEPEHMEAGEGRHAMVFSVAEPGQPTSVSIQFEAEQMGPLSGALSINDEPPVELWQFVYP